MIDKVDEVRRQIDALPPGENLAENVAEFLDEYPEFVFTPLDRGNSTIYYDLEKKITPFGFKKNLNYDFDELVPLIEEELQFLMKVHNLMKQILRVVSAKGNKALFLRVIELELKKELNTGGGASPATKRVVMIYEKLGCVVARKKLKVIDERIFDEVVVEVERLPEDLRVFLNETLNDEELDFGMDFTNGYLGNDVVA